MTLVVRPQLIQGTTLFPALQGPSVVLTLAEELTLRGSGAQRSWLETWRTSCRSATAGRGPGAV